ncbi:hypothetical protein INT45_009553 [Circinella minor]|uniref:Metallo-beta-lactamase domain-containing protein n=1 Tax=Circinella minor TaxID=1195481 RepID=A0A8H7S7S9_9FUNG|nr:hypothetical protein INT45_009553 [Circinella minor]
MSTFKSQVFMTHIGTATTLIEVDGITFLTDPVFCDAGSEYHYPNATLTQTDGPAVKIDELPPIDAVLLSHEDHKDNLDDMGRRLLDGRRVITTMDGAKNLRPRPGVRGIQPWETLPLKIGEKSFSITGVPCQHVPGNECTGFVVKSPTFGTSADGKPNVIYLSGDTVYFEELVSIREKYHVSVAIIHLGAAKVPLPGHEGLVQITMGGSDAAKLVRNLGADVLVPIHFESWLHFTEYRDDLRKVFEEEKVLDKVCWLTPGESKQVI